MRAELKGLLLEYIGDENKSDYTYEIMAEIAIIMATKMDTNHRDQFFEKFLTKFQNDIEYLKDETLYKILWSFIKADRLTVREDGYEWFRVRTAIQKRAKEMDPKVLTDILVLSTRAKDDEDTSKKNDFWDAVESTMIMKMNTMQLDDLINLMWSSNEIQKGSDLFRRELEKELTKRLLKI